MIAELGPSAVCASVYYSTRRCPERSGSEHDVESCAEGVGGTTVLRESDGRALYSQRCVNGFPNLDSNTRLTIQTSLASGARRPDNRPFGKRYYRVAGIIQSFAARHPRVTDNDRCRVASRPSGHRLGRSWKRAQLGDQNNDAFKTSWSRLHVLRALLWAPTIRSRSAACFVVLLLSEFSQ